MNDSLLQRRAAPRRTDRWAGAFGLGAALLLSACGGGGSDDTAQAQPEMTLGEPVSKTLGATGGSIELTTWGVKVTVTVPKDALAADTPLRITPEQPRAGDSVRLKPKR